MLKELEKKKKIVSWRLRLLGLMKFNLEMYKYMNENGWTGQHDYLEFAKELGRDSEKLKGILEKMR